MNASRLCAAAALASGAWLASVAPATADACPVMTFQFDPGQGALVLDPSSVSVAAGGCVTFNNQTATPASFAVGSGYRATIGPFSETTGDGNYQASDAGTTQPVTATGPGGQASGSIVIGAAAPASSSPAPPPSSAPPPATTPASAPPSSSPHPTAKKSTTAPAVTPTASPPPVSPLASKPAGSPPVIAGQTSPSPSPSSSRRAVVVAGPLQPPTGRGTGLPAAVAAIVIVGTAAALLRVLLAFPTSAVDSAHSVRAAS